MEILHTQAFAVVTSALYCALAFVFMRLGWARSSWLISSVCSVLFYRELFPAFFIASVVVYAVLAAIAETRERWRWATLWMIVLFSIFLAGQFFGWQSSTTVHVGSLALPVFYMHMWQVLALTTLAWDVGSGKQKLPAFRDFLWWVFLPMATSGPLLRYSQADPRSCPEFSLVRTTKWWSGLAGALTKLGLGMALPVVLRHFTASGATGWSKGLDALFVGPWSFYLTTSGLFHSMELFGAVCGLRIPPSFNFPFFRVNIAEFWANWNMTATAVFREYFFYNRWGRDTYNVYLNTMVVFVMMGVWHGTNAYWLLFGVLHGIGFSLFLATRPWRLRLAGSGRWFEYASAAITYVFVCSAWYLPSKILQIAEMR